MPDPQPEGDQEEDHPEPGPDGACRQEAHGLRHPRHFLGELGLEELEMLLEEPANVGDKPSPELEQTCGSLGVSDCHECLASSGLSDGRRSATRARARRRRR